MAEEKTDEFPTEEEIAAENKKEDEVEEEKKEEKKEPDKKEEKKEVEPEIEEPEVRKSAKDYIIERKDKKIEKLEKKEEEDLEEDLTPEGRKAIEKGVNKATSPILKTLKTQSDEQELTDVMKNHTGAKKMEKQIRKYMDHPAYKSASVEFIYLALAAKRDRLQVKKDEVNTDAKKNKTGGHSRRKLDEGKLPDFKNMSDKEFDEFDKKFQTGQIQA